MADWDVSNVVSFLQMFDGAEGFNQDLSKWNTQSATDMSYMFRGTTSLSKPVYFRNVGNVVNMNRMFVRSAVPSVKFEKT